MLNRMIDYLYLKKVRFTFEYAKYLTKTLKSVFRGSMQWFFNSSLRSLCSVGTTHRVIPH